MPDAMPRPPAVTGSLPALLRAEGHALGDRLEHVCGFADAHLGSIGKAH